MKNITLLCMMFLNFSFPSILKAQASEPFLGQIAFVPYNFTPKYWSECNGALLPISQNQALFSLIGTTYGGNGTTNFALPDMRGRVLISNGQGPGLSTYVMGQTGGSENVTLTSSQMPAHSHTVNATTTEGNQNSPSGNLPADTKALDKEYSSTSANTTMNPGMIAPAGGNQPHENRPPFITLKCIIALQGIYPTIN